MFGFLENVARIKKGMLRWFGHVERINAKRVAKQIYAEELSGAGTARDVLDAFIAQISDILKIGLIKSTLNRRACTRKDVTREMCHVLGLGQVP